MPKKISVVIIGATGLEQEQIVKALNNSRLIRVVAIQGSDELRLKEFCAEQEIPKYYLNEREMLKNRNYDMVFIASPPFMHYDSLVSCLDYQKPIVCNAPLGVDYKNALKIQALLNGMKLPFMVANYTRHQKAAEDIKKIIDKNQIGEVISVYAQWGCKLDHKAKSSAWKLNPLLGGKGTLSDNGIHVVDLLIYLFGEPETVKSHTFNLTTQNSLDNESALLCYKNKTIFLNSSWTMPNAGNHLLIYGTKGKIEVFNGLVENGVQRIEITVNGQKTVKEYTPINLYLNEVESFIKHYLLEKKTVHSGTSLDEAMLAMKLIDKIRK